MNPRGAKVWFNWLTEKPSVKDILPVLLVLALVMAMAWLGVRDKSNTVDEVVHITSGYSYWTFNDYRLAPESGNFVNRIASLPLLLDSAKYRIETDTGLWESSDQWEITKAWWYGSGNDPRDILRMARMAMLSFNILGIALVFYLSGSMWGRGAGYFSLFLAGFSPNFLGHMALATTDFAGAWTLVLATVCYARTLEKISPQRVLLAGLTAGIAILCKHSGLIIGPVAIVILLWRLWEVNSLATIGLPKLSFQTSKLRIFIFLSLASIGSGLIALCVIWTAYGWRFTAANPDVGTFTQFQVEWVTVESGGLLSKSLIGFAREWRLLPEAFLFGMDFIIARSDRGGFLNGEISEHAHPLFYVWNFLYKTPFPALLLHIAGWVAVLLAFFKYRALINLHARSLIVLGLFYAAVLLTTSLNIGYRHAFPALFVSCFLASATIAWTASMKSRSCFVLLALAISLFPMALANRDYYISYVNPFGGGREGGYKSLTDSSLDWGQDLPAAARFIEDWEKDNPDKPVYLASFGTALPSAYGIKTAQYLPFWGFRQREAYHPVLESGLYILSATALTLTYEPWTKDIELAYLGTKSAAVDLYERLRSGGNLSLDKARRNLNDAELRTLEDFEFLRCKRLVYYLHARSPDRIINGSMLAFVLGEEELEELGW